MTNLLTELRPALRRLAREPGFTVLATTVLAVGIGIIATVFALVEGILIRPLPYPDAARLVSVRHIAPGVDFTRDGVSPGIFLHYRDGNRVFDGIAAYSPESGILTVGDRAEPILTSRVSSRLFDLLGVVPRLGRLPGAEDHTFDYTAGTGTLPALISHDLWVRRFAADPEVVGRALELDGHSFVVVVGVAPAGFSFPDPATEAWIVMEHDAAPWSAYATVRNGMTLNAIARLRPGRALEDAEADLNRLVGLLPDAFGDITGEDLRQMELRATVRPYKEEVVGDVRLSLLLVLGSAGFLLLVTWANVANLMLLRTHGRRAELGIIRAIGATERHVAGRILSESLILSVGGGLLGLWLANLAIASRIGFAAVELPRLDAVGMNASVAGLVAALTLASAALLALVCLGSARMRVAGPAASALRTRSATEGADGQIGRRILVAAQLAIALTLLVGSGLMARTFWQLNRADPGFRSEGRLMFSIPTSHLGLEPDYHDYARVFDRVFRSLREVPGVDAVESTSAGAFPLTVPEFLDVQRIAVVDAARGDDERDSRAIYLPHVHPAAADVITGTLQHFLPLNDVLVVRTDRDRAAVVPELRRAVEAVDPRLTIQDLASVDDVVAAATARERATMRILIGSAMAAVFLGVVGVYGVLAYAVRRRTAEIGIRMALGASPSVVRRFVVRQGAVLTGAGIAAGIVAGLLLTQFMGSLLYETTPADPLTFAGTAALLFAVALMASYLPARRASRIDPTRALRAE